MNININTINYNELDILLKRVQDIVDRGKVNVVFINRQKLIVYQDGSIIRILRNGTQKLVENKVNDSCGYNQLGCNGRMYLRHRIITYSFLGLDINDTNIQVDHVDGDRIKNHVNNLGIVTHQQNQWNRTKAKGYSWRKKLKKYQASIRLNNSSIYLGVFTTKEEARNAYLNAKLIYHKI